MVVGSRRRRSAQPIEKIGPQYSAALAEGAEVPESVETILRWRHRRQLGIGAATEPGEGQPAVSIACVYWPWTNDIHLGQKAC